MPVDNEGREPGEAGYNRAEAETKAGEHGKPGKPDEHGKTGTTAWLKAHRDVVLITLTLAGVIIGWLALRGGKSGGAAAGGAYDPTSAAGATSGGALGSPGVDGNSGGAIDGFSALLSHMQDQINDLEAIPPGGSGSSGTPSSAPKPFDFSSFSHSWANEPLNAAPRFLFGRAAQGLRYIRNRRTGRIYQVNPNGKLYRLTGPQYAELGRPKFTDFGSAPKPKPKPKPPRHRRR